MKNVDWDALIPEMKSWNNGAGIDAEGWVSCTGNFQLASAYSLIYWPQFTELDGMVFRGEMDQRTLDEWVKNCGGNRRSIEATANHLHILDLQHVGCPDASIEHVIYLGRVLKEIYAVKLAADFPEKRFVVEFYEPENQNLQDYQLTFYQQS